MVQSFEDAIHVGRRASAGGDLRLPRQAEHPPPFFVIPAQGGRAIFVYNHVLGSARCPGSRPAAKQDVVTPDDHGALDVDRIRRRWNGWTSIREKPSEASGGSSSRW